MDATWFEKNYAELVLFDQLSIYRTLVYFFPIIYSFLENMEVVYGYQLDRILGCSFKQILEYFVQS